MPNPTVVITHLDDEELKKSINALVATYNKGLNDMVSATNTKVEEMQNKLKTLGSSPMFGGASTDSGSSKRTKDLSHEGELIESLAVSYNKLVESIERLISAKGVASSDKEAKIVAPDTIGELEQSIATIKKERKELELNSEELKKQNTELDKRKNLLKEQTTSQATKRLDSAMSLSTNNLEDAQKKLRLLEILQHRYGDTTELSVAQQKKLAQAIQRTKNEIDKIKPKSLKDVLDMDESSVDAIAKKMAALKKVQINPDNKNEVKKLSQAYQDLTQKQNNLLGKNAQVTQSNLSLARSFGYIRNRLVYALTLGAITNFVKQIYEVRGEYEMLERSLGILIDDARKGSEIFEELNQMALKSPFTLMELGGAAKQLTAYNFAAEEVVDTTRRLADISAALGVPMERLTYNLGQIKAQGVLNARDARDFANAGLAIVPMLAQMYTEQKRFGDEMVTTAQVYDMMSKKMVTYKDVMAVLTKVTDEGGKFFDYQAKQAETLRVKMANLTLAFNNMLNEIGKEEQSTLELPLKSLKLLFENWRDVVRVVNSVVVAYGAYKAAAMLVYVWNQRMAIAGAVKSFYDLAKAVGIAKAAMIQFNVVLDANPIGLITAALGAVIAYFTFFNDSVSDATGYIERFGEAGAKVVKDVESLFDSLEGMTQGTSNYKKVMGELNNILEDYGVELVNEKDGIDVINEKRQVAINLIKQEIVERKHLNDLEQGKETYNKATEEAKNELQEDLTNAVLTNVSGENVRKNAPAIANIIADVVENNIMEIAGKTGEEYEKGLDKIYSIIHDRMRAIGLSEKEIAAAWMTEGLFYHANILPKYIDKVKDAKEAQDTYNESTNKAYEAEKKAADANTTLKEKTDATARSLMKSANDTEALHSAINQIIKDYSGLNIIDFLVRVNAQVPKWMMDKSVSELSQLAVKFAALAKNAKGDVTIGKTKYTKEQLATRAALYAQAAQQKQANIESEKTTTITQKASEALKEYKQALDGVKVAQNLVKQGQKDASFVTKKQTEAQNAYTKALKAGVSEQELLEAKNGKKKGGGSKKDELGEALSKEVQYISDIQKRFKEYQKDGVNAQEALIKSSNDFGKSIQQNNAILQKYGVRTLSSAQLATMPLQEIRDFYKEQLKGANLSAKGVESLEKAISNLNVEITKIDYKRITDGLNNELSKIKDEYELAVELDANPELGGIFMDIFDIDPNNLPNTIDAYAKRVMEALNRSFEKQGKGFRLDTLSLTDDDLKAYKAESEKQMGAISEEDYKNIEKYTKEIRNLRKKDREDTLKQTQDLQYKLGDVNEKIAIESKKLTDLQVKYQKETNEEKKRLLNLQIKDQKNAIAKLGEEVMQMLPTYKNLFNSIAEHSAVVTRRIAEQWKNALENAVKNPDGTYTITDPKNGEKATLSEKEYGRQLDKVNGKLRETQSSFSKINEAFTKGEDGEIDFAKGLEYIAGEAQKAADGLHTIADIVSALGGSEDAVEVLNDVATSMEGVATAGQGIAQISSGDYIGGAVNVIKGTWQAISTWLDNGDKKISRQIEESERHVKALETSYQDLQDAMEDAYGYGEVAAKRATITNKELQLVELQRQLQLEKSRKKKNQDANRIMELQSAIINLRNELDGSTKDIVNDLLGISSVGDAAEQLVSSMIDAFKNGEDYMKVYEDSFEDMIDNLIMKAIVGEIVGRKVQQMFDAVEKESTKRADKTAYSAKMPSTRDMLEELYPDYGITEKNIRDYNNIYFNRIREAKTFEEVLSAYEKSQADALQRGEQNFYDMLQKQKEFVLSEYADAATIRPEDLSVLTPEWKESWMDGVDDMFKSTMDTLGITFGEGAEKSLSNLQQGIAGITEETAGALEAITSGMSQQVYYHSTLLEQIRDAVVGFDLDVSLGVQSQMLLQLQQSYAVQMAIQSILVGWSNPSGQAVRVELLS